MTTRPAPAATKAKTRRPEAAGDRNRYADLLRVTAIGLVVVGHWLLTDIRYQHGILSGLSALPYVSWAGWATLGFQVMPVFFLVGGYANAVSWTAHHAAGQRWTGWVQARAMRLLWPTTVYVGAAVLVVAVLRTFGVRPVVLAQAGWFTALHLWFLPVYLLLIAATPVLLAAHHRWGFAVPVAMAVGACAVDAIVITLHPPVVGFANYLLVWGCMHQWGFAWHDGTLRTPRWRPAALAAAGSALLAILVGWGPFPIDMIGTGQRIGNTTPPSVALLAFAATQTGLLLLAQPMATRLLGHPKPWRLVSRLNTTVMTVYLWQMAPVILVAVACYPTGLLPQPPTGTASWWALRPAWLALLTAVLVPLTWALMWVQRPLRRLPTGVGRSGRYSPLLLALGIAAAMVAVARLAVAGFAPTGELPLPVLAAYAAGLAAILLAGHDRAVVARG
jgi:acyltransferase-like protein